MAFDLLSDVLAMVRLTGALMFRIDMRGPWGIAAHPTLAKFASVLPPGTNQIMAFHLVLEGACWICHGEDGGRVIHAGEAMVLTHGSPHQLADRAGRPLQPLASMLGGRSVLDLRQARFDNGPGDSVSLLCGFLGCDRHAFEPLFHYLPLAFHVGLGADFCALTRHVVRDALNDSPGARSLRIRLAELLLTETLRRHIRSLPGDATGWLAGLRDPVVCSALHALHAAPARHWSVAELADLTACSRSCLAGRFRRLIGEPPMQYLTRLRMQAAARELSNGRCTVETIASTVGYDSSAAFQRAFKSRFGVPPGRWRREHVPH